MHVLSYTVLTLMAGGLAYLAFVLWRNRNLKTDKDVKVYKSAAGIPYGKLDKPRR